MKMHSREQLDRFWAESPHIRATGGVGLPRRLCGR